MRIWADGDSLQAEIRGLLERRAGALRARLSAAQEAGAEDAGAPPPLLVFVAARPLRHGPESELVLVEAGPQAADERLLELAAPGDLAVTRDIPLAERLAERGVLVLNDRGELMTPDIARERRSLRDRAEELRALGLAPPSPRARTWGPREFKAFADALDRVLSRISPRA